MLYDWVRDYVAKYSFVDHVKFENALFKIYYKVDGKMKVTVLPYRTTKNQLESRIQKIKEEINYSEIKRERDKQVRASVRHIDPVIYF